MNDATNGNERLEDLIVRYLGDELDQAEEQELAALLAESDEARALLATYLRLEGATLTLADAGCLSQPSQVSTGIPIAAPRSPGRWWQSATTVAWVTAACLVAFATIVFLRRDSAQQQEVADPVPQAVEQPAFATITRVVDVDWSSETPAHLPGSRFRPGTLALDSGVVALEFDSGVQLVLEGPAELELLTAERGFLHYGRLRSHVPQSAQGLTIDTVEITVVDLGTEFGLTIDEAGNAEVHVFDGEIQLYETRQSSILAENETQLLNAGEALQIDSLGNHQSIEPDDAAFVGPSLLTTLNDAYINDLNQQVTDLGAREIDIRTRLDAKLSLASQTPEMIEKTAAVASAKKDLLRFDEAHPKLAEAFQREQAAKRSLEELLVQKLRAQPEAATLLGHLARLIRDRTGLNKKERRKALREKRQIQVKLGELRQQIAKQDPEIRAARSQLSQTRKSKQALKGIKQHANLIRDLKQAQKALHNAEKKFVHNDPEIRNLRAQKKLIGTRVQKTLRRLQETQQTVAAARG